jgi:hypothetical protein
MEITKNFGSVKLKSQSKESVVEPPSQPIDLSAFQQPESPFERLTGLDIAEEFAKKQRECDEGICRDCLVFLGAGLTPVGVAEVIRMRWCGKGYNVTKEKIEQAVSMAVELLKQREKKS